MWAWGLTAATEAPCSPTRRQISVRAPLVKDARGAITAEVSVQVTVSHSRWRQRQTRFTHTSVTGRPPRAGPARSAGLAHSLGSIGDAYDNAVVESFWARMQTEPLDTRTWRTRTELSTEIFD